MADRGSPPGFGRPEDRPRPSPPPELADRALADLIDDGNVLGVQRALREQNIRLTRVIAEVDRVLQGGQGNLGCVLVTGLISEFRVAQASTLGERVLAHADTAGTEELVDLAAALIQQERCRVAERVVAVVLDRDPDHERALYLSARVAARRGCIHAAADAIARVRADVLEGPGLVIAGRYAALSGRHTEARRALSAARARDPEGVLMPAIAAVEAILERAALLAVDLSGPFDLRTALALEYGSLLLEKARDGEDGGRFGTTPIALEEVARLIAGVLYVAALLGLPMTDFISADEDGEIVARALERLTGRSAQPFRLGQVIRDGTWLCMGSSAGHPHLDRPAIEQLQAAMESGPLRSFALVMPCGVRGPWVPDLVGRIAEEDGLPWGLDDEIEPLLEAMFGIPLVRADLPGGAVVLEDLERAAVRFGTTLRAIAPMPRPGHLPYTDELPVVRK